jgi:hypothetical protein
MLLEKLLKPLRIGKGLLCLIAMFVMLLAPQGAWATVYTTSTDGPTSTTSEGAKFTWTITDLNKDLYVYSSKSDNNSVTLSSSSVGLSVYENGCTIKASGIEPKSMYDRLIYKVKLLGNGISNDKIAVYVDDFAFTASSTDGEFYVLNPVSWSSYDELSIEITNSCTITGIQISTSVVDLQDKSYNWPYSPPTDNEVAISDAKHDNNNDSIFININEHISYSYEFSVSATYSSSNTGVAEVANDGSVTIKGTGSTTITAAFQNGDNDIIPFSYILTVTDEAVSYGLSVAGVPVTSSNASHILGDNDQSVTYDALTNTLTLNNAKIKVEEGEEPNEFPCIEYSGSTGLTIKLIGDNSLVNEVGVTAIRSYSGGSLTFAKGDTQPCSLQLSTRDDSVIDGFSAVHGVNGIGGAKGNFLALYNASASYNATNGLYTGEETPVSSATIISGYDICVEGVLVHEGNKDNVLGDQEETHKVTFTPAVAAEGDDPAIPATLTLNGINYSPDDGDTTPLVVSSLDNLTVKLAGSSSVYVSSQAEVYPAAAFVSTNSEAVLTFTTYESTNLQPLNTNSIELASGFKNIVFTGYLYREQNMVKNLLAPMPSMDDKYFTVNRAGYEPEGTTFNYVIDYTDNSASVNGTYDMSKTASENNILLDKPCTVTVYAQYGTVKSAEKEGRLFGFVGGNELNVTYGIAQATMPTLVPAIAEADGITIMKEGNFVDANDKTIIDLTGKTIGKASTTIITLLTASNDTPYSLLNNSVSLNVNILPPAPTIEFDNTKTYLNSDYVSISLPEALQENEFVSIKYSWDVDCKPENGSNYDDQTKVALNAGIDTLYAWVRYYDNEAQEAVFSERAEQKFTVKTNINQLLAINLMDRVDTVYTGEVIVPTFTLCNAKDETQTLSADNYDVRIEKYVDENTGYAVVESIVDAGQYMVYAVGKGDNYGGEKIIYERITVLKASLGFVKVEEVENAIYNGDEQQLVTVSNLPEGATVEYIWQAISEDNFNDGSFDLMCCVDGVPFTQTPPTSTNVGYFAFVYRLKGGANYNDTYASGTIKVALYPATVTKVTLDETALTYNTFAQAPTITSVKAGDDLTLTTNDYTVGYEKINSDETTTQIAATDVKAVGSYNVVVTGQGNFTGTAKAPFAIVNRTLAEGEVTFYNHWTTYYSYDGDVELPEGIGAYIIRQSGIGQNTVEVTPIKTIPCNVAVLLNDETTPTDGLTEVTGNMLVHADKDTLVSQINGDVYGLHNGTFMRVSGTIPAGKNYLYLELAQAQQPQAPQLTIVFDGGSTDIKGVKEVREVKDKTFYTLDGRKVEKPSKKGLYIKNGSKVVVK